MTGQGLAAMRTRPPAAAGGGGAATPSSSSSSSSSLSDSIHQEFLCKVCHNILKDPRVVCWNDHYVCLGCIPQLVTSQGARTIACPQCHEVILMPATDPDDLPKPPRAVLNLLSLVNSSFTSMSGPCSSSHDKKKDVQLTLPPLSNVVDVLHRGRYKVFHDQVWCSKRGGGWGHYQASDPHLFATLHIQVHELKLPLNDLSLPKIMVAGNESHGKSTVLNRLAAGSYFPQDRDWCTRMPILLNMVNTGPGQERRCIVRIPAIGKHPSSEEDISSYVEPALGIRQIMQDVVERAGVDANGCGLVDQELVVEVRSPDVPTLELVDLPGIVETPMELRNVTRAMTRKYMEQPNMLILCMVNANTPRLRTSQAVGLIRELGIESRSIAVLTMW